MKKTALFILFAVLCAIIPACDAATTVEDEFSHYYMDATFDPETRTVSATFSVDFFNCYDLPVADLALRLYGNAFLDENAVSQSAREEAYYQGESKGSITLGEIMVNGTVRPSAVSQSGHATRIALGEEIFPGERVRIDTTYCLTLAQVNSRLGLTQNTVNLTHWYPEVAVLLDGEWQDGDFTAIGDPFFTECADFDVSLTVPTGYTLATSGTLVEKSKASGTETHKFRAQKVRDFAAILSRDFRTTSALSGATMITYYSLFDASPDKTLRLAQDALTYFSERFGAYPYPTLALVEAPLCASGMEQSALVIIGTNLDDKTHVVVHEIAHQWWSQIAGNNPISQAFFDEGLAEWSAAEFYVQHGQENRAIALKEQWEKRYVLYLDVMARTTGAVSTAMTKPLKDFASEYEYEVIAYGKGFLMFDSIAALIGKDNFVAGLHRLVQETKYKIFDTKMALGLMEMGAKRKMEGIFNAWEQGRVSYYLVGEI